MVFRTKYIKVLKPLIILEVVITSFLKLKILWVILNQKYNYKDYIAFSF